LESLASYLASGLDLSEALEDLRKQSGLPELRQILGHVLVDVRSGVALSQAMSRHDHVFGSTVTTMIGVGEEVGELATQLKAASAHLRHLDEIANLSRRSLAYPLVTLTVVLGVFGFWAMVVVPALADTFMDMGQDLPEPMRAMLWVSGAMRAYGLIILAMVAGLVLLIWAGVKKSTRMRRWLDILLFKLPYIGPVLVQAANARALELFGVLLGNGVDPDKTLRLAAKSMSNSHYQDMLMRARMLVSGGMPLSEALRRGGALQDAPLRMLHVGERSGQLREQSDLAAAECRRELNHSVQMLSKMVEPFLLVIFTLLLSFFILGFLAPIYQSLGGM